MRNRTLLTGQGLIRRQRLEWSTLTIFCITLITLVWWLPIHMFWQIIATVALLIFGLCMAMEISDAAYYAETTISHSLDIKEISITIGLVSVIALILCAVFYVTVTVQIVAQVIVIIFMAILGFIRLSGIIIRETSKTEFALVSIVLGIVLRFPVLSHSLAALAIIVIMLIIAFLILFAIISSHYEGLKEKGGREFYQGPTPDIGDAKSVAVTI